LLSREKGIFGNLLVAITAAGVWIGPNPLVRAT
jgi:hypothetical protein